MLDLAKHLLDDGDCTLVVVSASGEARKCHCRGVSDLLALLDSKPALLRGACVADKVVGRAAAALMIEGGVSRVFSRVMTRDALAMLREAGIDASWGELADIVENRDKTGRCPLDTGCSSIASTPEMVDFIRRFYKSDGQMAHEKNPQ